MFLSAGIDKQRAFEFFENFRTICAEVNPENNPEVDNRLRELRRQAKNRQSAKEGLKQLKRIQGMNRIQGMLRPCLVKHDAKLIQL